MIICMVIMFTFGMRRVFPWLMEVFQAQELS
jgi:hypothetical protein